MSMDDLGLDAMFVFTVSMGVITFLMAWILAVVAIKGWVVRRSSPSPSPFQNGFEFRDTA